MPELHLLCFDAFFWWAGGLLPTETFVYFCNMVSSAQGAWAIKLAEAWT